MAVVPPINRCQPRFVAYCRAHGLAEGDEWKPHEYITWILRMSDEFKRLKRMKHTDIFTRVLHEEFTEYLRRPPYESTQ
ncbi:hypothetical protein [Brevibacillus borstelensis]|uniref:hypothetical protein n=1 Tax=Brevibacillus borstelensis TaxID=45462 RepID=UPI00287FC182|nr:hypothetical protein [Brevibacillus borstelensis]WNF07460.1 hypothetical protein RFB14_08680 [Brevibacillus borstelensis]